MTKSGRTEYCVEVNLDPGNKDYPWIELVIGRFVFRTLACMKMIELKAAYPKFDYRVTPV